MVSVILNNASALLGGGKGPSAHAAAPAQANAAAKAAREAAKSTPAAPAPEPRPNVGTTPGVVFDLSETALQAVAAASAAPESRVGTPAAVTAAPQDPPAFMPAAMAIVAQIAAVTTPVTTVPAKPETGSAEAAPQSADAVSATARPALSPAWTAAGAQIQQGGSAPSARAGEAVDPDEEARARGQAVRAQEREQVSSLAERLSQAKADPLVALTAPKPEKAAADAGAANPAPNKQ